MQAGKYIILAGLQARDARIRQADIKKLRITPNQSPKQSFGQTAFYQLPTF